MFRVGQDEVSCLEYYCPCFPFSLVNCLGLALFDVIPSSSDPVVKIQDEIIHCRAPTWLGQGNWHSGLSAMTKEEQGVSQARVHCVVVCKLIHKEIVFPIMLSSVHETPESLYEGLVLLLDKWV